MKKSVIPTVISAFILSAVTVLSPMQNVFAKNITPVYEDFNANDVNGKITVEIPEKASAEIKINFTSPEVTDEPYYITDADGGNSYSFDVEGRDTTDDDYRNYTLSVEVTSLDYNDTIVYTDTFTVPDGNDNPDSFRDMTYTFTIDNEDTGSEWDISSETQTQKNISLHMSNYLKGDVNGDDLVDAVDATQIQQYYAKLSATGESTFNERQLLAADVNNDDLVDAVDATQIQQYYAKLSALGHATWPNEENKTTTTTVPNSTTTTTSVSSTKQSTTTTTNTTPKTTVSSTTTTTANIDYSCYFDAVKIMAGETDSLLYHNYYIYDINDDGVYELIIEMGTCEADNEYSVYSIKDNEMIFAGDIGAGHSVLTEKDGKLYKNYTQMGSQSIDLISFDGKTVSTENVYEKEQSETYIEYGTNIQSYDWSNTLVLIKLPYTYYNTDKASSDFHFNQTYNDGTVSTDIGPLNLRTAPNLNGEIILEMPKDSPVRIYGYNSEWYYVSYKQYNITFYGYASSQYITEIQ
ncbi:MAG: SH3 domain-containing protein [Ruminococcus sp.]|nr:SH3 domain-containing protein [Ruminococcus sp.]